MGVRDVVHNEGGGAYDVTVKDLFGGQSAELIGYLTGLPVENLQDLNIEFPRLERKTADLVFGGRVFDEEAVVHVEFQSGNDPQMAVRMLRYATDIHGAHGLPVYQVVVYFGDREPAMAEGIAYQVGDESRLDYRYRLLDLGALKYEEVKNGPHPVLYGLLPAVDRERRRREGNAFLETCVRDVLESSLEIEEKRTALVRVEIFAGLMFTRDVIERIFREVEHMLNLQESAGYQRIFEKGLEKGLEKGREQGLEKGQQRALQETAISQLKKKFRGIPETYLARVRRQDSETLRRILDDIFEMTNLADLERYLK